MKSIPQKRGLDSLHPLHFCSLMGKPNPSNVECVFEVADVGSCYWQGGVARIHRRPNFEFWHGRFLKAPNPPSSINRLDRSMALVSYLQLTVVAEARLRFASFSREQFDVYPHHPPELTALTSDPILWVILGMLDQLILSSTHLWSGRGC